MKSQATGKQDAFWNRRQISCVRVTQLFLKVGDDFPTNTSQECVHVDWTHTLLLIKKRRKRCKWHSSVRRKEILPSWKQHPENRVFLAPCTSTSFQDHEHGIPFFSAISTLDRKKRGRSQFTHCTDSTQQQWWKTHNYTRVTLTSYLYPSPSPPSFVLRKPWQSSTNSHHALHVRLSLAAANFQRPATSARHDQNISPKANSHPVFALPAFRFPRDSRCPTACYLFIRERNAGK